MMMLNANMQKMYYALYAGEEPVYDLDEDGNKIIDYVDEDGNIYYRETGEYKASYTEPVLFSGNIAMSSGESTQQEFGVSQADYEAILITGKSLIPATETSLIWFETEPVIVDGKADGYSADYRVIKKHPSLNVDKYILGKVLK